MSDSAFDPASFLDATVAEPNTRRPPLPVGDYQATISDLKASNWQKKDDPSKQGAMFTAVLKIHVTDATIQAAIGTDSVTLSDTIFLDTTPSGGLDNAPGKNGSLRRYREALDMNKAGIPFVARQMIGRTLKVKIKHEPYNGEMQDRIDGVARI